MGWFSGQIANVEKYTSTQINKLSPNQLSMLSGAIDGVVLGSTVAAAALATTPFITALFAFLALDYAISVIFDRESAVEGLMKFAKKKLLELFPKSAEFINKVMAGFENILAGVQILSAPAKGITGSIKSRLKSKLQKRSSTSGLNQEQDYKLAYNTNNVFLPKYNSEYQNNNYKQPFLSFTA